MALVTVGQRYTSSHADRVALLRRAAGVIALRGYVSSDKPFSKGVSILSAMAIAAAAFSNASEANSDGMFCVNSRFLIMSGTLSRDRRESWATFAAELDQESAIAFLEGIAALIEASA